MKVLIVTVDGLHSGYVGCYGNEWIETPAIDRLAAEGIVFDGHYADQPDTAGARRAWRTGCFDFRSGDAARQNNLLLALAEQGVATNLVTDGRDEPDNFMKSWQTVRHTQQMRTGPRLKRTFQNVDNVLDDLSDSDSWLLWLDVGTLQSPWQIPPEFQSHYFGESNPEQLADQETDDEHDLQPWTGPLPDCVLAEDDASFLRLQRTFAAAVTHFDSELGVLIEQLRGTGFLDEIHFILTSGHGLPLGEHGYVGDKLTQLHEELVHLPLIVRLPRKESAGRRVPYFSQSVDLLPTLFQIWNLPPPAVDGQSLLPLCRGESQIARPVACSVLRSDARTQSALRTADRACLFSEPVADPERDVLLFVKPDDRWEVNNIAQHFPEQAEEMRAYLHQTIF